MKSAFVSSKWSFFIVAIIKISLKCWSRTSNRFFIFILIDFHWVRVLIQIRRSNKCSFLLHESIHIVKFLLCLFSTKCWNCCIKCIHCSRHCINKFRLWLINKTIYFICILFNFFSFLHYLRIWFPTFALFTWCCSLSKFLIVIRSKRYSLSILKFLNLISFFNSYIKRFLIVRFNFLLLIIKLWGISCSYINKRGYS